jgi:hypothetical protein
MNHVKVVAKGWTGYTGLIGVVRFKNGISDEPLSRPMIDRLSAVVRMVECTSKGEEISGAGIAHRLVNDTAQRAPVRRSLMRQSEAAKADEEAKRLDKKPRKQASERRIHTEAELDEIIQKDGIKGLREVADQWGLKGRRLDELLANVISAQNKFVADRGQRIQLAAEKREEAVKAQKASDASAAETLLGSNILASTYEIAGQTVRLGDIVSGAFRRFGGTIGEWNALADGPREDLLRLELDRLLAAVE